MTPADERRDEALFDRLAADFEPVRHPVPGDELLARRLACRAVRDLAPAAARPWLPAAAAIATLGLGVAAAWYMGRPAVPDTATPPRPVSHPAGRGTGRPSPTPNPAAADRTARRPAAPATEAPRSRPATRTLTPDAAATAARRVQTEHPTSAAALFEAARRAEHAGRAGQAARSYRRLLATYPDARESAVALVALGWLELERLGRPRGALERFRRYQTRWPRGPLAREAMEGEARALQRLGRSEEARAAWRRLAARFPDALLPPEARRLVAGSSEAP